MKKLIGALCALAAVCLGVAIGGIAKTAAASRNSAGTYSLPNSPFVSGTTISSSAMNGNFSDLSGEISNSLDRTGRGGMLAALRGVDGTVSAPAFSFTSEPGTGLYRVGSGNPALAIGGVKYVEWSNQAGGPAETRTLPGSASQNAANWLAPSLASGNSVTLNIGSALTANNLGVLSYNSNATAANSTFCMGILGTTGGTLCVDGNNKTIIGANGGGIGASKVVTVSLTPGAIAGPGCNSGVAQGTSVAVPNIAFGDTCMMAPPSSFTDGRIWTTCSVNSAGNVTVDICSMVNVTPPTGTYTIRTFQAAN